MLWNAKSSGTGKDPLRMLAIDCLRYFVSLSCNRPIKAMYDQKGHLNAAVLATIVSGCYVRVRNDPRSRFERMRDELLAFVMFRLRQSIFRYKDDDILRTEDLSSPFPPSYEVPVRMTSCMHVSIEAIDAACLAIRWYVSYSSNEVMSWWLANPNDRLGDRLGVWN